MAASTLHRRDDTNPKALWKEKLCVQGSRTGVWEEPLYLLGWEEGSMNWNSTRQVPSEICWCCRLCSS